VSNDELVESLDRALDDVGRGVIVVDPDGRLVAATPTARRMLGDHLGVRPTVGQRLPARLAALGRATPSRARPVCLDGQGAALCARLLEERPSGRRTIVIDERAPGVVPSLGAAGLTRREHDILRLVAGGRSNTEIAAATGLSVRTVHKHLEHLYTKLDVHDRTAAAARWFSEHGPACTDP
jgi:DNA-binding CsgD family transcriptional regulator